MAFARDLRGTEQAALEASVDFSGRRVLEVGCGNGRLTWRCAAAASEVLAIDPDEGALAQARATIPRALTERVRFRAARLEELDLEPSRWDAIFFSWTL